MDFKVPLLEETAFVPKGLLADGALEPILLGLPSGILKRPFADGALDVEEPNPEKTVVLGDVPVDASLFAVVLKRLPVEIAFEV